MQVCFFSILNVKVLLRIKFKYGISVLQSRCSSEIFGNVFVALKSFSVLGNIDIMAIMPTPVVHCLKRNKVFHGENEIAVTKPVIDHF